MDCDEGDSDGWQDLCLEESQQAADKSDESGVDDWSLFAVEQCASSASSPLQAACTPQVETKRSRGRPKGYFGSRSLRRSFREDLQKEQTESRKATKGGSVTALVRWSSKRSNSMSDLNSSDSRCEPLIVDHIPGVGAIMEQTVFAAGVAGLPGLQAKAIADFEGAIDFGLVGAFSSQLLSLEGTAASNAGKHHVIANSARPIQRPPSTLSAEHGSAPDSNNTSMDMLLQRVFRPYRSYGSLVQESSHLQMDDKTFARHLSRTACAFKNLSNKLWGNMLEKIKNMLEDSHEGIMFICQLRFDETPSKIAISDLTVSTIPVVPDTGSQPMQPKQAVKKQLAKILQTEFSITAVMMDKVTKKCVSSAGGFRILFKYLTGKLVQTLQLPWKAPWLCPTSKTSPTHSRRGSC